MSPHNKTELEENSQKIAGHVTTVVLVTVCVLSCIGNLLLLLTVKKSNSRIANAVVLKQLALTGSIRTLLTTLPAAITSSVGHWVFRMSGCVLLEIYAQAITLANTCFLFLLILNRVALPFKKNSTKKSPAAFIMFFSLFIGTLHAESLESYVILPGFFSCQNTAVGFNTALSAIFNLCLNFIILLLSVSCCKCLKTYSTERHNDSESERTKSSTNVKRVQRQQTEKADTESTGSTNCTVLENPQTASVIIARVVLPLTLLTFSAEIVKFVGLFKFRNYRGNVYLFNLILSAAACLLQPVLFLLASSNIRAQFKNLLIGFFLNILQDAPSNKRGSDPELGNSKKSSLNIEVQLSDMTFFGSKESARLQKKSNDTNPSVNHQDVRLDIDLNKARFGNPPPLKRQSRKMSRAISELSVNSMSCRIGSDYRKTSGCSSMRTGYSGHMSFLDLAGDRRLSQFSGFHSPDLHTDRSLIQTISYAIDKESFPDCRSWDARSPSIFLPLPNRPRLPPIERTRQIMSFVDNATADIHHPAMPEIEQRSNVRRISTLTATNRDMGAGRRTSTLRIAVESYDADTGISVGVTKQRESDTGEMIARKRWLEA